MRWSRGLFRLWVVLSCLFVIAMGIAAYGQWPSKSETTWYMNENGEVTHGNLFDDEAFKAAQAGKHLTIDGYSIIIPNQESSAWKGYYRPKLPPLPPGFHLVNPDEQILFSAKDAYRRSLANDVLPFVEAALFFPAVVFAIGAAFIWAFHGFRKDA